MNPVILVILVHFLKSDAVGHITQKNVDHTAITLRGLVIGFYIKAHRGEIAFTCSHDRTVNANILLNNLFCGKELPIAKLKRIVIVYERLNRLISNPKKMPNTTK